jgi:hypothetical protein
VARPRESVRAKQRLVREAIAELLAEEGHPDRSVGGKRPTQREVSERVQMSEAWVRKYWPPGLRDPFVTTLTTGEFERRYAEDPDSIATRPSGLRDPFVTTLTTGEFERRYAENPDSIATRPWVGSREDAAASARVLRAAGLSQMEIADVLGLEEEKAVPRLLAMNED